MYVLFIACLLAILTHVVPTALRDCHVAKPEAIQQSALFVFSALMV